MDTILINLDFSETVRDKFKQEEVVTLHATGPSQACVIFLSKINVLSPINTIADFGVNSTTSNRQ